MTEPQPERESSRRYSPLAQLVSARLREFYREPEAVFWVYVFPLLMTIALGIAFRNQPVERFKVDVCRGSQAAALEQLLTQDNRFDLNVQDAEVCFQRLRTGKTDVVIVFSDSAAAQYEYHFDPTRPGSQVARHAVDDALRAEGRSEAAVTNDDGRRSVADALR